MTFVQRDTKQSSDAGLRYSIMSPILGIYMASHDLAPEFRSREIHFGITVLALFLFGRFFKQQIIYSYSFLRPVFIFFQLAAIITFISLLLYFSEAPPNWAYNILKTGWYAVRLPIYFLFGVIIGTRIKDSYVVFDALVVAGIFEAMQFIIRYWLDPNAAVADRFYIRSEIGHGGYVIPMATFSALFRLFTSRLRLSWNHMLALVLPPLFIFEMILSQSRSNFVAIGLFSLFALRLFPMRYYNNLALPAVLISGVILTTPFVFLLIPEDNLRQILFSIPESFTELIAIDRTGIESEINNYWRGYETFLAFDFVENSGLINIIFGTGLQSVVSMPHALLVGDKLMEELPIFHNGFSFIFVRGGLVGIALYIWQYIKFAEIVKFSATNANLASQMLGRLGCATLFLAATAMPTTAGFLNFDEGGSSSLLLFGICLGICCDWEKLDPHQTYGDSTSPTSALSTRRGYN